MFSLLLLGLLCWWWWWPSLAASRSPCQRIRLNWQTCHQRQRSSFKLQNGANFVQNISAFVSDSNRNDICSKYLWLTSDWNKNDWQVNFLDQTIIFKEMCAFHCCSCQLQNCEDVLRPQFHLRLLVGHFDLKPKKIWMYIYRQMFFKCASIKSWFLQSFYYSFDYNKQLFWSLSSTWQF